MVDESKMQFIDAESHYFEGRETYEELIIKQMNRCAEILSKEIVGGVIQSKMTKSGTIEKYVENVAEQQINTVDTFKIIMTPFIKPKSDEDKKIKKIEMEIDTFKKSLGNREIFISKRGWIKLKNMNQIKADHPIYQELINFKAMKSREFFKVLVVAYQKHKAYIRSLEIEE